MVPALRVYAHPHFGLLVPRFQCPGFFWVGLLPLPVPCLKPRSNRLDDLRLPVSACFARFGEEKSPSQCCLCFAIGLFRACSAYRRTSLPGVGTDRLQTGQKTTGK